MFSRNSQNGQSFFRFTSFVLNFVFIYLFAFFPFGNALIAAPQYKTFDERGKTQMESFFDKGKTLSTEAQWQNFVDQGLGVVEAQWESEARATLDAEQKAVDANTALDSAQKVQQKADAQAVFDQAKADWLAQAADRVLAERGKWKAIVGNAFVAEVDDAKYQQIITAARTAVLGQDLNLTLWDSTVQGGNSAIDAQFQSLLTAQINSIASANLALSGTERTAFDAELQKVESGIRAEYELKQNYYLRRARNQYIAEKRSDTGSAKSEAEKDSASYLTDQLLKQTWENVNGMTSQALTQAVNAALGTQSADLNNLGQDWQRQIEAIVSQGLKSWETAEEDLMERRIEWANKQKQLLADGGDIWKAQYERIRLAKEQWMTQIKTQIQQGRTLWDQKYVQFADERQRADSQFQQLLTTENDRWNGYNDKLIDMVTTGSSALSQAQDAVAFYNSVLPDTSDPAIRTFYQGQIGYFNSALTKFNTLLTNVRTEMQSTMLSQSPDSGYLVDKRVFAGTVPADIAALGPSGFKSALQTKLDTFSEAYVLYDRDLRNEITRADNYAQSSQFLGAELGNWFSGGYNFADVQAKLGTYSDAHANVKTDIMAIWTAINADNTNYPDEASKKAALQTQVQTLLTGGMNVDQSLFNRVTAYFNTPYGGNYLTGNDSDPYLMTQAEYEWELLRNRRNYLSQQLSTAEAVYNYAKVANASGAGLELASVTKEAANIQKTYADLAELKYKIYKGDIALANGVKTDANLRDSELNRLLAERGIDLNYIYGRQTQIATEKGTLDGVAGATVSQASDLDALITTFDPYRGTNSTAPYLAQFSDKLIQLKNDWVTGLTGTDLLEKQQRWLNLKSAAAALSQSLTDLQGNYRFSELGQRLSDVKTAMIQPTLVELGATLANDKSLIEAQALVVANAKAAYDLQQDIYRQTKKTFDIIALPNSQQIIATEISNTGQALAAVTNRMVMVNGVAEMKDVVSASEIDYYRILRERTEAQKDIGYTSKVIQAIDSLKVARQHNASLDTMLTNGFAGKSIDTIASDIIGQETNLIVRTGTTQSWTKAVELFDGLTAQKTAYLNARAQLVAAQGSGNATAIADAEKSALIAAEALRQNIDGFIVALRMEKKIDSEALDYLLDSQSTLGGQNAVLTATTLQKEVGDSVTRTNNQYEKVNEAAVNYLAGLVSGVIAGNQQSATNSETLIKAVDNQIAQLMGGTARDTAGTSWNGSSYDFGLFEGKTDTSFNINLERLWVVRAYLTDFNVKARIVNLSSIPPPGGDSIETKWQKFFQEVQGYQQKNAIYHQVTADAPQSANDAWVTTYQSNRTALKNDLSTILAAPNNTALSIALNNYLSGMAPAQADDTRFILQSYLGKYVNEANASTLRAELTTVFNGIQQELSKLSLDYSSVWAKEQYLSKDRSARTLETQLANTQNQIATKNLQIQTIDSDITRLTQLKADALAQVPPATAEANSIQTEIDNKNALKTTLQSDIATLGADSTNLRTQIDPLRSYASELAQRGSSLVLAPFVQNSLWQYRIEEEGYRQLNNQWSSVKDASYRVELANAQQGLTDTIKQVIGFYQKDAYGNIKRDLLSGNPLVDKDFLTANNLPVNTAANADISILLGGNQTGGNLENWVTLLTNYVDRAQAERQNVPDNLKQAISSLESSLVDYLSAQAYIADRNTASATITQNADATKLAESTRLTSIAKVLNFYQSINSAMSNYDSANGTSPIGAYTNFINEISKTQNRNLVSLFGTANEEIKVRDSLNDLFALGDQLKTVREQLYEAQIGQQFLKARQTAYSQNKVLSVSEFMAGVDVLKTSAMQTSINNITADGNFVTAVTSYLTGANASELYLSKMWDILSGFPANGDPIVLKSTMMAALANDTFTNQIRTDLNALSPRDLYQNVSAAGASIDAFLNEQATRADTFNTNLANFINGLPGATTTASAMTSIGAWMQNLTNVPEMQQDFAAEVTYFMGGLDGSMAFSAFKNTVATFIAQFANPTAGDQGKLKALTEQNELVKALNQYAYSATYNPANYPTELQKFVLLKGYDDLNSTYTEFKRLKNSSIADEQNQAVLDLSGHPKEMQRYFYLNDFYAYIDGAGAQGSAAGLTAYFNAAAGKKDATAYVADYLVSRKINSQIVGSDLVKEFTNIVLHTEYSKDNLSGVAAVTADINKESADFRSRLVMAKFDDYLQAQNPAAGMTNSAFNTFFDNFLTANSYKISGVTLKNQLSGNIELTDLRTQAFAYYNTNNAGGGNLSTYSPTLYMGLMSPTTLTAAYTRTNPDTLLPAQLTAIANFKTIGKGYTDSLSDSLKTIFLKQKLASNLTTDPGLISGAQIAQMISTSGFTISAGVNTALNQYFSDLSLATKVAADSPAAALSKLRITKAVETQFAAPADQIAKDGLLANRDSLSAVERASYDMMGQANPALRVLANKNEAQFLLATWEKVATQGTAIAVSAQSNTYYGALSSSDKALFDDYVLALGTRLTQANKQFVTDYVPELSTYLTGSSALFNGDLEKSEGVVRSAIEHLSAPALRKAANDNFNEFYKAFAQYLQGSGSGVTLGATTFTTADFDKMAGELNTAEKGFFAAEKPRLTTFFNTIQEATAERKHVENLVTDASLTNPFFALDTGYELKVAETLAKANLTAITDAISEKLKNNQAISSQHQRLYVRNTAIADNMKRFAAMRGDNVAAGGSLFLDYRSFVKSVADKQAVLYPNETPATLPAYLQGKSLQGNVLNSGSGYTLAQMDSMFNDASYKTNLISDRGLNQATDQVNFTDAQNIAQTTYLQTINKVNIDANPDFQTAFAEHLANNYLTSVSGMNRALASIFAMAGAQDALSGNNSRQQIVAGLGGAITTFKGGGSIDDLRVAVDAVQQNRNAKLLDDNAATGLSDKVLLGAQKQVEQNVGLLKDARQKLAEAGQRDVLLGSSARGFLQNTFNQVSTDLSNAELTYNLTLDNIDPNNLGMKQRKDKYAADFGAYSTAMNTMADAFKYFQVENADYEKKAAVKDFATTAYLFASSNQASSQNEADAKTMYDAAKAKYDQVQAQLTAKADEVRLQDTLQDLSNVITKVQNNVPLNATEQALKDRYDVFITARAEYVQESARMVRIKKAQEILNAEIEKRKAVAQLKLAAYNQAKDEFVSYDQNVLLQQKAVYQNAADNIDGILQNIITYAGTLNGADTAQNVQNALTNYISTQLQPYSNVDKVQTFLFAAMNSMQQAANGPNGSGVITAITSLANQNKVNLRNDIISSMTQFDPDALVYNRDQTIATLTAIKASRGNSGLIQVLSEMFYEDDTSFTGSSIYLKGNSTPLTEDAVINDRNQKSAYYNSINPADKAILDRYRSMTRIGALQSDEYGTFKSANATMIMDWESREASRHKLNWTMGVYTPVLLQGLAFIGIANGFFSAAAPKLSSRWPWNKVIGWVLQGFGYYFQGVGTIMSLGANLVIGAAQDDYNAKDDKWNGSRGAMDTARDVIAGQLDNIKNKEEEYLQAQAAVDYFTKAPSEQVLKERIIQYGAQTNDNSGLNKYTITEADLRYIKDSKSGYVDSTGAAYTPNAVDATRALNISSSATTPKFQTAAGDKYDPSQTTTQNLESTLQGGFYWLNGEKYVKIKQMAHNGTMQDVYAKSIATDVAPGGVWDAYSLGDVMNMSSNQTDALRTQLKQDYFNASTAHESTLMLNEREKTMWSLWDYADQQGKQYSGFKVMATDYQENSTNVFKSQQQQNASLVTQQWDLRKQQLDDAYARWQNLADTIEKRGTESFSASEQRFLKAWRQWEIETNRKIDAGKQQWNDKIKTFLVAKQDWQQEIKGAALEQSLDKMLGATGSALNERLRVLAANSDINTDIPEMNVTQIVSSAMDDFDRSRPSVDKIFGEINKSITAFNTTLELGNATHFKGFTSTTLEGNFAGEMADFSKHMAILNNAKMYENFKKMIDSFKANLKKTDIGTFKSLDTAAVAAGYHLSGGSYNKEVNDNLYRGTFDFMAYRYADIDAIMNRSMTEAGLDMATLTDGAKIVDLLEKKSDVDVKIFFEVQTMALEQAFKLAGGERGKKGYYQQYSGDPAQWKGYGGDIISEGSGEQGGWENGAKNNKLAWRGLHEEETKLSSARGDWQTAAQVTNGVITAVASTALTIGGCGACAVGLTMTMMGMQTAVQVGSSFSSNKTDQAWGQLGMGLIQMGVSALGSLAGGYDYFGGMAKDAGTLAKVGTVAAQVTLQNAVNYAGSGFHMNEDGSIGYKGPSKGSFYSMLASTAFGVAGGSVNAAAGFTGRTASMVTTTANALGAGFQFNDDGSSKAYDFGKMGISFAANTASTMTSYYAGSAAGNQYVGSQVGRLAHTITAAALGDKNALQNYSSQGIFSAIGNNLGDYAARRANGDVPNNQPLREIFLGSTIVTSRREQEAQEEQEENKGFDPLGDAMDKGVEATKGAFTAAANWTKENLLNPLGNWVSNAASATKDFLSVQVGQRLSNFLDGDGLSTDKQVVAKYLETFGPSIVADKDKPGTKYTDAEKATALAKLEKYGIKMDSTSALPDHVIKNMVAEYDKLARIYDAVSAKHGKEIGKDVVGAMFMDGLKKTSAIKGADKKWVPGVDGFDDINDPKNASYMATKKVASDLLRNDGDGGEMSLLWESPTGMVQRNITYTIVPAEYEYIKDASGKIIDKKLIKDKYLEVGAGDDKVKPFGVAEVHGDVDKHTIWYEAVNFSKDSGLWSGHFENKDYPYSYRDKDLPNDISDRGSSYNWVSENLYGKSSEKGKAATKTIESLFNYFGNPEGTTTMPTLPPQHDTKTLKPGAHGGKASTYTDLTNNQDLPPISRPESHSWLPFLGIYNERTKTTTIIKIDDDPRVARSKLRKYYGADY